MVYYYPANRRHAYKWTLLFQRWGVCWVHFCGDTMKIVSWSIFGNHLPSGSIENSLTLYTLNWLEVVVFILQSSFWIWCSANERRCCIVTPPLIGWAQPRMIHVLYHSWGGTGSWNPSSWNTESCSSCIVSIMAAHGLSIYIARASAAMVLTSSPEISSPNTRGNNRYMLNVMWDIMK